jgi:hypothetical protein
MLVGYENLGEKRSQQHSNPNNHGFGSRGIVIQRERARAARASGFAIGVERWSGGVRYVLEEIGMGGDGETGSSGTLVTTAPCGFAPSALYLPPPPPSIQAQQCSKVEQNGARYVPGVHLSFLLQSILIDVIVRMLMDVLTITIYLPMAEHGVI